MSMRRVESLYQFLQHSEGSVTKIILVLVIGLLHKTIRFIVSNVTSLKL
jgi:hypothetical protein